MALRPVDPWLVGALVAVAATSALELVGRIRKPPVWLFAAWGELPASERGRRFRPGVLLRLTAVLGLGWLMAAPDPHESREVQRQAAAVVVLDASSSMSADDFRPSRLEAARGALARFIQSRDGVDFGLVVFAAIPDLAAPVTSDRPAVMRALERVRLPSYGEDGTAIGAALSSAINRLRVGEWSRRAIVLLTDGVNNRGALAPLDATELARPLGIAVHVLGIGTPAPSRYSVPTPSGPVEVRARIEIDAAALRAVAARSGGAYHEVRDPTQLVRALESLDLGAAPEKRPEPLRRAPVSSAALAAAALGLLALELVTRRFLAAELPS